MSIDNLMTGRQGEKRFSLLCSDYGVTCNTSVEDDYGWDMMVEFPPKPQPMIAIDMRQTQQMASVQVKTTKGDSRSVSLSLSNALRYARSSLPTFILLVVIDGDETHFFIQHVWTALIASWLKAGREADALGVTAVHKQRVTLTFDDAPIPRQNLLSWMEQRIAEIRSPYAVAKDEIVRTIGFDNATGTATISLTLNGPQDFLDLQLGLKQNVSAQRFVFTSERFGIRARNPDIDLSDVQIEVIPEGRQGILRAEFPNGVRVSVDAKIFNASAGNLRAMRVASRCLELVCGPVDQISAHATLDVADTAVISDLALFSNLQATKPGDAIYLEIDVDGHAIDLGAITMKTPQRQKGWQWLALSIAVLRAIATEAARPVPDMSLDVVNEAVNDMVTLSALAGHTSTKIEFVPAPGTPRKFGSFLGYCSARIGRLWVGAVASRPIAIDKRIGKRRRIILGPAQILYGTLVEADALRDDQSRLIDAYQRQLERLSRSAEILALGDLQLIASQAGSDWPLRIDRS